MPPARPVSSNCRLAVRVPACLLHQQWCQSATSPSMRCGQAPNDAFQLLHATTPGSAGCVCKLFSCSLHQLHAHLSMCAMEKLGSSGSPCRTCSGACDRSVKSFCSSASAPSCATCSSSSHSQPGISTDLTTPAHASRTQSRPSNTSTCSWIVFCSRCRDLALDCRQDTWFCICRIQTEWQRERWCPA